MIVEADGNIHEKIEVKELDKQREVTLQNMGYTIIRFTNEEIINKIETVLAAIELKVDELQQRQIIN